LKDRPNETDSDSSAARTTPQACKGNRRSKIDTMNVSQPTARISVIIPHFDCGDLLGHAVKSILDQSFEDLEVLVVDDASPTDRWRTALSKFRFDRRLRVFRTNRNVGHYRIKNSLLPMIRSPFIALQDADDGSHRDRLSKQLEYLRRTGADMVGCGFNRVQTDEPSCVPVKMVRNANLWIKLGKKFVLLHPTTLMRRDLACRLGGFDGTARVAADSDFILRAAHIGRIRNVPEVLYDYRIRSESLMGAAETGPGSQLRQGYAIEMWRREKARRRLRGKDLLDDLRPPLNDIDFDLLPVELD
jgi:glycosyltransferase involved in cell wall biosynthesis